MKHALFISLLGITLSNCSSENYSIKKKFLVIDAPPSAVTLKFFENNQSQFYYLYDFRTLKTVYIFNDSGKLHKQMNLNDSELGRSNEFVDILIKNQNDYILLSKDNQLFRTNNQLKVEKSFSYAIERQNGLNFAPFLYHYKNEVSAAILATWPKGVTFETDSLSGVYLNSQPVIAQLNVENGECRKMGTGILHRFLEPLHNSGLVFYTSKKSGDFIYHSPFTDTIYEISRNNHIKPLIRIESKIGAITCPKLTTKQIIKDDQFIRNTFISNSWINYILVDDFQQINYVIIRKPLEKFKDFPFNILIYDQNWQKLDELEFAGDTYKLNFLVVKTGLLMERANTNSEKRIFDCLNYVN